MVAKDLLMEYPTSRQHCSEVNMYSYSFDTLIKGLKSRDHDRASYIEANRRKTPFGLLSVGLKIHGFGNHYDALDALFFELGGRSFVFERNMYRKTGKTFCFVLPPVGNSDVAVALIESIERFTGATIFGNPELQLQVCTPHRLDARGCAILGVLFYLCSDTIRRFSLDDFMMTASDDDVYTRGTRMILYDAGGLETDFPWWLARDRWFFLGSRPNILERLPISVKGRTDVLVGAGSRIDIRNVNLLASLLVHETVPHTARGFWHQQGVELKQAAEKLLAEHELSGVLSVPWVSVGKEGAPADNLFAAALDELQGYVFDEAARITNTGEADMPAIFHAADDLINRFRSTVYGSVERGEGK